MPHSSNSCWTTPSTLPSCVTATPATCATTRSSFTRQPTPAPAWSMRRSSSEMRQVSGRTVVSHRASTQYLKRYRRWVGSMHAPPRGEGSCGRMPQAPPSLRTQGRTLPRLRRHIRSCHLPPPTHQALTSAGPHPSSATKRKPHEPQAVSPTGTVRLHCAQWNTGGPAEGTVGGGLVGQASRPRRSISRIRISP
ncbi:exported hypothetical protein [Actinacidiphila cocklensis]|jgi:hypothetical protein|uniref:Uncharacterized protein n=1 Tax=Actinacidiphila cocklensis TaxID=887465 RepID=A0A9W4DVT9_9ACTN|nr:exported hypothetical protein [Actinacidiphila cocklensis]